MSLDADSYDVVIVGAGAGGASAAWAYAKLGKKVCLIERGDWPLKTDYPGNFIDWERRRHNEFSYDPNIRQNKADYLIDNSKSSIRAANFNGIGGSTVLYSGHFPRFHPSDFYAQSLDKVGDDWPIKYEDLLPYYELNDKNMNVAGLVGDTAYPDMQPLSRPISIGSYGSTLGKAFNDLGWHWWPSYSAISTTSNSGRVPCQNIGPCNTGCPSGAKSSVDVTYVQSAIKLGVKVLVNSPVLDLISSDSEVKGVLAQVNGKTTKILAKIVVVACNAIGTARLLLSHVKTLEKKIQNNISDHLGKNLMLHPLGYAEAILPHPTDVNLGPQGCCIFSHQFYETQESASFKRGYTMHVLRGSAGVDDVIRGLDRSDIRFGESFLKNFYDTKDRMAFMTIICEDLPRRSNEVYLTEKTDRDGLKVAGIKYELDENTKKMLSNGLGNAKKLFKAAGGKRIRVTGPVSDAGWHILGTARMGDDISNSVTSRIGEVHGLKRLFIADGSLFTTSSGVNPASTIQALALYVAESSSKKYLESKDLLHEVD